MSREKSKYERNRDRGLGTVGRRADLGEAVSLTVIEASDRDQAIVRTLLQQFIDATVFTESKARVRELLEGLTIGQTKIVSASPGTWRQIDVVKGK